MSQRQEPCSLQSLDSIWLKKNKNENKIPKVEAGKPSNEESRKKFRLDLNNFQIGGGSEILPQFENHLCLQTSTSRSLAGRFLCRYIAFAGYAGLKSTIPGETPLSPTWYREGSANITVQTSVSGQDQRQINFANKHGKSTCGEDMLDEEKGAIGRLWQRSCPTKVRRSREEIRLMGRGEMKMHYKMALGSLVS